MTAGFIAGGVVALLVFIVWLVTTLRNADRRALLGDAAVAVLKEKDDEISKLKTALDASHKRYLDLAQIATDKLPDAALVDLLARPHADRLLDPFAEDGRPTGPGPGEPLPP